MTTALTRPGTGKALLFAAGIASAVFLSAAAVGAAVAHADFVNNEINNEGHGQGGAPGGAPVATPGGSDDGDAIDIRSTQGIVRGSVMSHPGNLALPHVEGATAAGKICAEANCG